MAILKHINRIRFIDHMIKKKATGDLESFASKNNLCKSAMAGVIQEMKELGFPIKFDRMRNTYYYAEDGKMVDALFIRNGHILSREDIAKIESGGELCFSEITVFKLCENQ
ncbi:hypothetical protein LL912_17680 [Niabella sp. CC-SYL272]|uniref:hypothetical protein n=1 Tax=Niabella agricola TaxID=2891571 RepID=UPI001F3FACE9|nr:hypothetical protein [Niabella agricola]MCF3110621.1 hypothetical protein [Niabella agricola]